ncbi:hypothetical protein [Calothrix sp. 336/3]|uniref:hypothetical protein n=1 Tax=Calothrix sp. 336/3 TaxID=1337936 RepID=UPI00069B7E69|nr:hypothetical protein [Calothrix sp. 336/3]
MLKSLSKYFPHQSLIWLGILGASSILYSLTIVHQPAKAEESLAECIRNLMNEGISEQSAAIACRRDERDERDEPGERDERDEWRRDDNFVELRAKSGPTPEGRWRYDSSGIPDDAMSRAGCERVGWNDWRCPTRRIRVQVLDKNYRTVELRAKSGPTPEGRWRYDAPGIPSESMVRAGCESVGWSGWRCPTRRIRVQVAEKTERVVELRANSGPTPEGRWRYNANGIPYESMRRAGCENVRGDDWRCPSRRIRVTITE